MARQHEFKRGDAVEIMTPSKLGVRYWSLAGRRGVIDRVLDRWWVTITIDGFEKPQVVAADCVEPCSLLDVMSEIE